MDYCQNKYCLFHDLCKDDVTSMLMVAENECGSFVDLDFIVSWLDFNDNCFEVVDEDREEVYWNEMSFHKDYDRWNPKLYEKTDWEEWLEADPSDNFTINFID